MNVEKYQQQFEYECKCGYIWIDSQAINCPMCGDQNRITAEIYESLPPENFNKK